MSLTDTLAATLKAAQKANDVLTRDTLRLLLSAIQNEEIDARGKGKENLEDEDVSRVLQREAKKRKESILAYRAGKREALAEQEEKELKIIEGYLPEALSEEEVTRVALEVIGEVKPESPKDFGRVMSEVMKKVKGRVDGALVAQIVESCLKEET